MNFVGECEEKQAVGKVFSSMPFYLGFHQQMPSTFSVCLPDEASLTTKPLKRVPNSLFLSVEIKGVVKVITKISHYI